MGPIPPGRRFNKGQVDEKLMSVFKMLDNHLRYVDDVVDKINVEVNNVTLPKSEFRHLAHDVAKRHGMFEYKSDMKMTKSMAFHRKALGFIVGMMITVIFTLVIILIIFPEKREDIKATEVKTIKTISPTTKSTPDKPMFKEIE